MASRDPLGAVQRAAAAKRQADDEYRAAIVAAHAAGASFAELAATLGVSRQAVRQLVLRAEPAPDVARMRARLAELDSRYEQLVDALAAAEGKPGDYQRVTALQNGANAKSARRGRGPVYRTVRVQLRDLAESKLLAMLEHRADEPVVQRIRAELDEAAALRKQLTALDEARAFGSPID